MIFIHSFTHPRHPIVVGLLVHRLSWFWTKQNKTKNGSQITRRHAKTTAFQLCADNSVLTQMFKSAEFMLFFVSRNAKLWIDCLFTLTEWVVIVVVTFSDHFYWKKGQFCNLRFFFFGYCCDVPSSTVPAINALVFLVMCLRTCSSVKNGIEVKQLGSNWAGKNSSTYKYKFVYRLHFEVHKIPWPLI